ncbi:hypothetical protein Q4520_04520 [Alteromonas sp. 1_MG-2023]|uniref:hypothetical protein n=1 Tax=Alteromonas sp. 1_MG-2023 TaxID=3062669 RepID=UPI0026E1DAAB|nr:hypothetical protein [Alteromonas sp. 1_MG-2023]MDO6474670.1 hypothetical protein [Alteromonas sp. 1_MG-2023]
MYKIIGMAAFLMLTLNLAGCAGLGNMKEIEFREAPEQNQATVNFVRRSIFMADGANSEVWDGDEFVGTLKAGTLIQYQTTPGKHTFMVSLQGHWAVAEGELEAGKSYYLKLNLTGWGPIILGVADSMDSRIEEWNTMKTVARDDATSKPVPPKYIEQARATLKRVEDGNANVTHITSEHAR